MTDDEERDESDWLSVVREMFAQGERYGRWTTAMAVGVLLVLLVLAAVFVGLAAQAIPQ